MREDLRQLGRDLAALAPEQRAALMLREMSGLSHAEIATALDATPAAAKQLIHDARRNLVAFEWGASSRAPKCSAPSPTTTAGCCEGARSRATCAAARSVSLLRESIRERGLGRCGSCFHLSPPPPRRASSPPSSEGTASSPGAPAVAGGLGGGGLVGGMAAKVAMVAATAIVGTAAVGIPLGLADRVTGGDDPAAAPALQPAGSSSVVPGATTVAEGRAASSRSGGDARWRRGAARGRAVGRRARRGVAGAAAGSAGGGAGASAGVGVGAGVAGGAASADVRWIRARDGRAPTPPWAGERSARGRASRAARRTCRPAPGPPPSAPAPTPRATSAGATVAAPPATVEAGSGGATVEAPGVTVEVPVPPILP